MTVSTPARPLRPGSRRLGRLGAAVVAAATLALGGTAAGCSETEDKGGTTAAQADRVGVSDVWVKSARSGMTAAFGTLVNEGGAEVRLESVTTDLAARVELHETVTNDDGSERLYTWVTNRYVSTTGSGGDTYLTLNADKTQATFSDGAQSGTFDVATGKLKFPAFIKTAAH